MHRRRAARSSIPAQARRLARGALALLLLSAPAVAHAADPAPTLRLRSLPGERATLEEEAPDGPEATREELGERLCEALARLELAQGEHVKAAAAYRRMRRDDYPRGPARELVQQWRLRTRSELEAARRDLASLRERADWRIDAEEALSACGGADG